jgi:hypothetical protein
MVAGGSGKAEGEREEAMSDVRNIPLTQGQMAIVDASDYDWLSQWKWHAVWNPGTKSFYAHRQEPTGGNPRQRSVRMHRQIIGILHGDRRMVDHANHDTLDNRRSNLRPASNSENQRNREAGPTNTSGFKGVSWHKNDKKWHSRVMVQGKTVFFKGFLSREEAASAYDEEALKHFGEFAVLNFPRARILND